MIAQEDTLFYYEFGLKANMVIKCDFPCYLYRQRETSVMHTRNEDRAIKYYKTMLIMYEVYKQHLNKRDYKNEEALKDRILHSQQNIAYCLAMITDHGYVREEMRRLKLKRIYPYPFRNEALHTKEMFLRRICNWLLPIEPVFWILHYIYARINLFRYKKT